MRLLLSRQTIQAEAAWRPDTLEAQPLMLAVLLLSALLQVAQADDELPVVVDDPSVFSCSPAHLDATGARIIVLTKHDESLRELSVQRPGSEAPHFLVVAQAPAEMQPLMSPDAFASATRIEVDPVILEGLEWKRGAQNERVFDSPGVYTFFASAVLESEAGGYTCTVILDERM
jgi:hypothetical protein